MPRRGLPSEGVGELVDVLQRQQQRIRTLEIPTGEQLSRTLAKVQQLIADLPGMVTAYLASGFTTGSMTASGAVTAAGDIKTTAGHLFTPAGYSYDITYTRRTAWLGNDGRVAWASSSRRRKTNIEPSMVDPLAVLRVSSFVFQYLAEVAKRDDPSSEGYVGPDYTVAWEFGTMAEDLDELGLGVVVDYDEDGSPAGINYSGLGLLAIEAAKYVWEQHQDLERRVSAIENLLG